ncbi:short-chain dehydrogenase/reductase SDR [Xylariaceae sp. AK1471]|nr:short-chain dehydrogenase/reductase SDR [Xylariaceae sp. AK1471]
MSLLIDGIAIVTGASSGIGKECCLAFAAEGARAVVLADINHNAAMEVARESESLATNPDYKTLAIAVDVTDINSVNQMVEETVKAFGRIDYSVNSAGVGVQKPLPIGEADNAEMNRFWQVNVMGTFNCVQTVTQAMKGQSMRKITGRGTGKEAERDIGRGVILNLGSGNSYFATPNIVQYTTAKHAVMGLTKNAALDNARHGIRVNAICPGWVDTPMVSAAIAGDANLPKMMNAVIPMSRIARTEEIADVIMFMVSPRSSYVTGVGWIVDGGTSLQLQAV